jgi:hypothetical protein
VSRDLAFGGLGLLLAAGYFALTTAVPESQLADAVGPQGLPRIYALVLALLSSALIVSALRTRTPPASSSGSRRIGTEVRRAAGMLLIGVAYLAVVSWFGYVVSIGALLLASTWYLGGRTNGQAVLIAVCGAAFFWLLFVALLGVQHPVGALFEF